MLPLPNFNPTVLIFDVDETVLSTYIKFAKFPLKHYNQHNSLSSSTKNLLCQDPERHFELYQEDHRIYCLQAIARDEFKKVFDKVYEIKNTHKEKCPIAIKIMTRGDYSEKEINDIWEKFYGNGDERFTKNLLPIEIFNFSSFNKNGKPFSNDVDSKELRKEELIGEHFPKWEMELPGLEKSRVCLLDDDYDTTVKVKECGFGSIHFPTDEDNRPFNSTLTEGGPKAFAALHQLIDTAFPKV